MNGYTTLWEKSNDKTAIMKEDYKEIESILTNQKIKTYDMFKRRY